MTSNDDDIENFYFETGDVIGRGGFGSVFRGTFRKKYTMRTIPVAIKKVQLIPIDKEDEEGNREKDAMSQLLHNNVVQLLHVQDKGKFRFYGLELCDGSLDDYFKEEYQGPMADDVDALNQMARGLRYIHSQKLVHRDIKPGNILISPQSADVVLLKISDFGLCKPTNDQGSLSLSGPRGTQKYMAPELLKLIDTEGNDETLKRGSVAADVFSMGIVFFRFLASGHKHPFDDGIPLLILANIIQGKRNLTALANGPCCHLIERMLAAGAADRPAITQVCSQLKKQQTKSPPEIEGKRRSCYDVNEGKIVHCCRFHPTKPKLACGLDGGRICLFSGQSHAAPFVEWNKSVWKATTDGKILCIDWKVDGSNLAAGCADGTVVVWDEDGAKSFEMKEHSDWVRCIQWNKAQGGSHVFITGGTDKRAIIWDSDQKFALQVFRFHSHWVRDVAWISADQFASCSNDGTVGTVQICQLGRSDPLKTFYHEGRILSLRWNESDGRLASCNSDGSIRIWSLDGDEPRATLNGGEYGLHCLDWNGRSGTEGAESGRWWIAGGSFDGDVLILDFDGPATEPRILTGHSNSVYSVAFSSDGQFLASGDASGMAIIWWTKKWQPIFHVYTGQIFPQHQLNFNPSGNKLAIPSGSPEIVVVELLREESPSG